MLALSICIIVLLPQLVAGLRRKGPAAHLTLLLMSICAVITLMAVLAIRHTAPVVSGDGRSLAPLVWPLLVWPVLGVCLLVPLYATLEQTCRACDLRLDSIVVQALALIFTAALWSEAQDATPVGIELGALALISVLFTRGIWLFTQTFVEK
jgi:hypothetical protein